MRLTKKEKLAEIERIAKLKGAKRWRAVADFTIKTNAKVRKQHEAQLREIERLRDTRLNDNGSSATNKGFRFGVSVPTGVYKAIVGFDLQVDGDCLLRNPRKTHEDPTGTNAIVRQLARTFPEYKVYKNITPTKEGYRANNN